jgi:hypothetical protein
VAKKVPLFGDDKATAMLAKAMALHAFRNPIEDLHAGIFPSSKTGDYSDVKVVTPYGEIPWNQLGRISDDEMKPLMIEVVANLYTLLSVLDDIQQQAVICVLGYEAIVKWDNPSVREDLQKAITHPTGSANRDVLGHIVGTIFQSGADRRSKAQGK